MTSESFVGTTVAMVRGLGRSMVAGFHVDLDALRNAAEGITDTLNTMATRKVSDIDAAESAFGHGLGGTVADFCERWQLGVENLTTDGQEIVDRLVASVYAYEHVERTTGATFDGILRQSSGPDPAAR